jgi:hypothetical protein
MHICLLKLTGNFYWGPHAAVVVAGENVVIAGFGVVFFAAEVVFGGVVGQTCGAGLDAARAQRLGEVEVPA